MIKIVSVILAAGIATAGALTLQSPPPAGTGDRPGIREETPECFGKKRRRNKGRNWKNRKTTKKAYPKTKAPVRAENDRLHSETTGLDWLKANNPKK